MGVEKLSGETETDLAVLRVVCYIVERGKRENAKSAAWRKHCPPSHASKSRAHGDTLLGRLCGWRHYGSCDRSDPRPCGNARSRTEHQGAAAKVLVQQSPAPVFGNDA